MTHFQMPKKAEDQFLAFLSNNRANSNILPNQLPRKVITVRQDATVGEAFKQIIENRVLSVVVVDSEKKPIFALGLKHIIAYMLQVFDEDDFGPEFYLKIMNWMTESPHLQKAERFSKKRIHHMMQDIDVHLDPVPQMSEDATLLEVLQLLTETKSHRIHILDKNQRICSIITQSQIVSLIHGMELPKSKKTLQDLHLDRSDVISVLNTDTAFQAFRLMAQKKVSGLAVVDDKGELVGNISISDLKLIGWNAEYWNLLGFHIKDYLAQIANHPEYVIRDYNFWTLDRPHNVVLKCRPEDTIFAVMRIMCFFRVHRVYVTSEDNKPIGVVSMGDILSHIISKISE